MDSRIKATITFVALCGMVLAGISIPLQPARAQQTSQAAAPGANYAQSVDCSAAFQFIAALMGADNPDLQGVSIRANQWSEYGLAIDPSKRLTHEAAIAGSFNAMRQRFVDSGMDKSVLQEIIDPLDTVCRKAPVLPTAALVEEEKITADTQEKYDFFVGCAADSLYLSGFGADLKAIIDKFRAKARETIPGKSEGDYESDYRRAFVKRLEDMKKAEDEPDQASMKKYDRCGRAAAYL